MNYKEKYNEALNIARELVEQHRQVVLAIFPELKQEADNEKVRKEIIEFIKKRDRCGCDYDYDKWIAYLEKLKTFTEHGEGIYYLHNNDFTYIGGNQTSDVEQEVRNAFHCASPKLKVSEYEKVRKELMDFVNANTISNDSRRERYLTWLKKQDEHKSTNETERKFHEGDWIVFNGLTLLVNQVFHDYYRTISIDGLYNSYDRNIDNAARLWTLKDAKDGDILVVNERPFIFKGFLDNNHPNHPVAYGGICTMGSFTCSSSNIWWDNKKEDMKPATKEERELLFQRMKEDGYVWNGDTKEIKKSL